MKENSHSIGPGFDNPNDETKAPIPGWIVKGGIALAAILCAALFALFRAGGTTQQQALIDIEKSSVKNGGLNSETNTEEAPIPINSALKLEPLTHDFNRSDQKKAEALKTIESKLDVVQTQLASFLAENTDSDGESKVLLQAIQSLASQLNAQDAKMNQVNEKFGIVLKTLEQRKPVKPVRKKTTSPPPFTLVGVDQWGADRYAVIRHLGELHEVTEGNTLAGWRVESIDKDHGTVTVQNASGKTHRLSIKS